MNLLERQIAFRSEIAAADGAEPASSTGMQAYRDAYRGRLLAALEVSFERTRRWVGDQAFTVAACHYILTQPPRGWTLDDYGAEFPRVLEALFAEDPEVAELAWLEWHMQQAFGARNSARLDPAELAAAGFDASDWGRMQFEFAPGFACRSVKTDCISLWSHLQSNQVSEFEVNLLSERAIAVWRQDFSPKFRELDPSEHNALEAISCGTTLGAVARDYGPELLGQWLAQWLGDGLFSGARTSPVKS